MNSYNRLDSVSATPTVSVENSLQLGLMNQFMTGNPFIDPIINMCIFTVVGVLIMNLKTILNISNIKYYLDKGWGHITFYWYKYFGKESHTINKEVIINYFTPHKKINYMYHALDWYISTKLDVDMVKETPLELCFDKNPEDLIVEFKSSAKITQNRYKSFDYKGYEIFYLLDKNLITVYSDRDRKKENHSIKLSTKMEADADTDVLKEFCDMCLEQYIKSKKPDRWEQLIYINSVDGKWNSQKSNSSRKLETVILQGDQLEKIRDDIDDFLKSKKWYNDRDIPYTRGYLFYGFPGTGKTSLIKAVANHTKRHIHYLILDNVQTDEQLLGLFRQIDYDKTVVVVEDIDCMSKIVGDRNKDRTKVGDSNKDNDNTDKTILKKIKKLEKKLEEKNGNGGPTPKSASRLTLSGLLNALDGVFNNDGRILIMTTNHPEVLDNALIRSGRVDMKVMFDFCNHDQIRRLYKMFYDEEPDMEIVEQVEEGKYAPADVTSALLMYKRDPKAGLQNIGSSQTIKKEWYDKQALNKI